MVILSFINQTHHGFTGYWKLRQVFHLIFNYYQILKGAILNTLSNIMPFTPCIYVPHLCMSFLFPNTDLLFYDTFYNVIYIKHIIGLVSESSSTHSTSWKQGLQISFPPLYTQWLGRCITYNKSWWNKIHCRNLDKICMFSTCICEMTFLVLNKVSDIYYCFLGLIHERFSNYYG